MEREQIFQKVSDVIRQVMMAKNLVVQPENNMADDLGMDSMGAVEFVNAIEDEYKISVTEDEVLTIKTVNDAIELILKKTNHGS
jgi:acyl carrier protein